MIEGPEVAALFWYIHRPMGKSAMPGDGGFTVTLYENDALIFTVFNDMRTPIQSLTFPVPCELREQYMALLNASDWWLRSLPLNLRASQPPAHASLLGFCGHPMFVVEDIEIMAAAPFATQQGHFARRLYLMLEDLSEMLAGYGLYLEPARFTWDQRMISPLPPSDVYPPY